MCRSPQLRDEQCKNPVKDSEMYCHFHIDQRPVKVQCQGTCRSPPLRGKQCKNQVRWERQFCHHHINQSPAAKSVQFSPMEPVITEDMPSLVDDTRPRQLVYPSPAPLNVKEPIDMPQAPSTPIIHQTRPRPRLHRRCAPATSVIDSTHPRPSTRTKENADGAFFLVLLFILVMLVSLLSGAPAASSNALSLGSTPVAATPKWMEAISTHLEAISASTAHVLHRVWASSSVAANTATTALCGVRDYTTTFLQQGLSYVEEFVQRGVETAVGAVRSLQQCLCVAGDKVAGVCQDARRFMRSTLAAVSQSASGRMVSRHWHTLVAAAVHLVRSCDHSRVPAEAGCPVVAVC